MADKTMDLNREALQRIRDAAHEKAGMCGEWRNGGPWTDLARAADYIDACLARAGVLAPTPGAAETDGGG